jgi:hypothetical protein
MRGQAFSTMKILMGAIFAVTMLSIVYYIISAYSPPLTGIETVGNMIKQANNAPNKCFSQDRVDFTKDDSIDARSFQPFTVRLHSASAVISCTGTDRCTVKNKVSTPVAAMCSGSTCDVYFASSACP